MCVACGKSIHGDAIWQRTDALRGKVVPAEPWHPFCHETVFNQDLTDAQVAKILFPTVTQK